MKKIVTTVLCAAFIFVLSDIAYGQFTVGGGVIYGGDIEQVGAKADLSYTLNETYRLQADFSYFLPKDQGIVEFNWWEINGNLHYPITRAGTSWVYALAGINIANINAEADGFEPNTVTEVGANVGAGGEIELPFADLFGEIKYVLGNADQLGIAVGLRFSLGK